MILDVKATWKIISLIALAWSLCIGARDIGVWFTLNNEESSIIFNHLWFFLGPFAFFPCLLLSFVFPKVFGGILLFCGGIFCLISIVERPFSLHLNEIIMQMLEIGIPMIVLGTFQILKTKEQLNVI